MLTVDFRRLPVAPGDRVLDLGSGNGRHAYEVFRRGAHVVAVDYDPGELAAVSGMFDAMRAAEEIPDEASATTVCADARDLPFPDASFDHVIAAEVLEHIPDDEAAMAEIVRVLKPNGFAAVTVPRWFPERVCWALSDAYHEVEGGHVRIYTQHTLATRLARAGLTAYARHHAHALHSPYWWLRCAVGDEHVLPRMYHKVLVWDIVSRPWVTRFAEQTLNPVLGKSLVLYARKRQGADA